MEYFLSHIVYILIAGGFIAAVAVAGVLLSEKNNRERDIDDQPCNYHCQSCPNTAVCHKEGKREV